MEPSQAIPVLLRDALTDRQLQQLRSLDPRLEIHRYEELETQPDLIERCRVHYGAVRRDLWDRIEQLEWIQTPMAGVERLDYEAIERAGAVVTNASGIHGQPMAEQVFGLLLMHCRRLDLAHDRRRDKAWAHSEIRPQIQTLRGRTLGVLGVGGIGTAIARVGRAFKMEPILGCRRSGEPHAEIDEMFTPDRRREFFARSEVIVNSLPVDG